MMLVSDWCGCGCLFFGNLTRSFGVLFVGGRLFLDIDGFFVFCFGVAVDGDYSGFGFGWSTGLMTEFKTGGTGGVLFECFLVVFGKFFELA